MFAGVVCTALMFVFSIVFHPVLLPGGPRGQTLSGTLELSTSVETTGAVWVCVCAVGQ